MFQLDDKFLEEVGLGSLPADQKQAFLAHLREQLELRVGTQLSEGLSDAPLKNIKLPALILHGSADSFVPIQNAYDIYELINSPKMIYTSKIGRASCRERV